jgi:triosephosphate isomerase
VKRYAVANWKMNVPAEGVGTYLDAVGSLPGVVVAPPFPYLREVAVRTTAAGQNCAAERAGAFTGEVSPDMLRDCGAEFVIVGHSERRRLFGEGDEVVARKLEKAITAGVTPIFCVGEDMVVRNGGGATRFIANQIRAAALAVEDAKEIVIAYEPIWAIGTGRNATGDVVAEMVGHIRSTVGRYWPKRVSGTAPILYGGSVTPENIEDIGSNGRIAGYLVGGASLESARFAAICAGLDRLDPA